MSNPTLPPERHTRRRLAGDGTDLELGEPLQLFPTDQPERKPAGPYDPLEPEDAQ